MESKGEDFDGCPLPSFLCVVSVSRATPQMFHGGFAWKCTKALLVPESLLLLGCTKLVDVNCQTAMKSRHGNSDVVEVAVFFMASETRFLDFPSVGAR